jgi:hypothetical protein
MNRSKNEVIMTRALKSFDDFSLKVVAVRTADNSDFEFEYPPRAPNQHPLPGRLLLSSAWNAAAILCRRLMNGIMEE